MRNDLLDPLFLKKLDIVDFGLTSDPIPLSFDKYAEWVDSGDAGDLAYLTDERKLKRRDLRLVYPDFKQAIVFLFSYSEVKKGLIDFFKDKKFRFAGYALAYGGKDYHFELKDRLSLIGESLKKSYPGLEYEFALDIMPVLERDLAYKAGLGWFGKNSMLIHPDEGSYFLIGSLLLNSEIGQPKSELITDHCGHCSKCVDACPTNAIDTQKRTIISNKCISTFTIETFKETKPPEGYDKTPDIFGCDICQDVCPWNDRLISKVKSRALQSDFFKKMKDVFFKGDLLQNIESMSGKGFKRFFKGSVFLRPGKKGFIKNLIYQNTFLKKT